MKSKSYDVCEFELTVTYFVLGQGIAHNLLGLFLGTWYFCCRWAQVTRFLVIVDKELNRTHKEFVAEREQIY